MPKSLLIAITARSKNNVIGLDHKLPWHISEDLKFFKQQTLNKPMIMGRKTRDSFGKKPLPKRPHIVISHNPHYQADESFICDNIDTAISHAHTINQETDCSEIYIIGGGTLYNQTIDIVDRLIISDIDIIVDGDTYFPDFNPKVFSKKILHEYPHLPIPFNIIQYDRLR
ncbi:MAG: dihydrofolate reductase [Alphaproteobacteria bacterium]|jgi:dihydrofolate reductase